MPFIPRLICSSRKSAVLPLKRITLGKRKTKQRKKKYPEEKAKALTPALCFFFEKNSRTFADSKSSYKT